jgi:hypothetical protein
VTPASAKTKTERPGRAAWFRRARVVLGGLPSAASTCYPEVVLEETPMNTVRKLYESDDHGTVHLDVMVGAPHRRVEVVIVWQEVDAARQAREQKRAELEALAGALADDPIVRPEQLPLETRLPVE